MTGSSLNLRSVLAAPEHDASAPAQSRFVLCQQTTSISSLLAELEDTFLMTSLINLSWFFPRWVVQPTITSSWPTPAPAALLAWLLEVWAQVQAPPEVPLQWAPCTDQEGARRGSPSTQTTALDHSRDT